MIHLVLMVIGILGAALVAPNSAGAFAFFAAVALSNEVVFLLVADRWRTEAFLRSL